jgi:DNA-directed RNA polymerase subunit alpha
MRGRAKTTVGESATVTFSLALKRASLELAFSFERAPSDVVKESASRRSELLNRTVTTLEFSVRTDNMLRNAEVEYIGQLVQKSEAQILRLPNAGRKSLNEIKENLAALGLYLGVDLNDWVPPLPKKTARTS